MTAKLKTGVSVVVPPVVRNVRLKLPAATAVTIRSYRSVPDFWFRMITSVAATVLLVTVKVAAVVEPAALNMVIAPVVLFNVTPVVRLVNCVTAPPAPVAYPTPAVPDDVIAAVAARLVPVAAPITGVTMTMLVLVQAEITPLATVPRAGVTIVGPVNSKVLLMLLVVPAWTNGTISAALMTVATGKPEMATVVIIKSSQRKCCSVDDWQLCRKALPSHRQGC